MVAPIATGVNSAVDVNGTVYAFIGANPPTQIATLNLTNGSTAFVSSADAEAGLIFGAAATPEPGSIFLAALGIGASVFFGRFRGWRRGQQA
jgi:hypothetical protein